MKSFVIAVLLASTQAIQLRTVKGAEWPSVARCNNNDVSKDDTPCDHDNRMVHPHDNTVHNLAQWPSVARCNNNDVSKDDTPCDHDNRMVHPHDNTVHNLAQWPSVARCNNNDVSKDDTPCDHDNRMAHPHDNTVHNLVQLSEEMRPVIKCKDPVTGNPISCDYDDIVDYNPLPKDVNGFTPINEVLGGPRFEGKTAPEAPASKTEKEEAEA